MHKRALGFRGGNSWLEKAAIAGPDFIHVAAQLARIFWHFRMFFRTQNVLMHERKMRHVEKVLDHAKAGGTHLYPTAGNKAAIGLAGFWDIENFPLRLAK